MMANSWYLINTVSSLGAKQRCQWKKVYKSISVRQLQEPSTGKYNRPLKIRREQECPNILNVESLLFRGVKKVCNSGLTCVKDRS